MKVAGIIAEYNPFHNGHAYHIAKTRENADAVICVMSGAFTQRGKPAIINKWARAEMAVKNGADLVLELPFPFSAAPAEIFAFGGVDLLNKTGCVDMLSFGSEGGELEPLVKTAELLEEKGREISQTVRERAGEGKSYAAAVAEALGDLEESGIMDSPNNLLGVKYLMALNKLKATIEPFTVKREGGYNSLSLEGDFASAAAIRNAVSENMDFFGYMPEGAFEIFKREKQAGRIYKVSNIDALFTGLLRRNENLSDIAYVAEGVENRFVKAAETCFTVDSIIDFVKTKRYTHTRLSRISASILVGMDKSTLAENMAGGVAYARVLGANGTGTALLREIKENIPVISRGGDYASLDEYGRKQFELEMKAGNICALCAENSAERIANTDLLKSPYIER